MFDDAVRHVEQTWSHVIHGSSSLSEKVEFTGELIGIVGVAGLAMAGLARCPAAAKLLLPKLSIEDSPVIANTDVLALGHERFADQIGLLFERIRGRVGEKMGILRFVDASDAKTPQALVRRIIKETEDRPLRNVFINSHGFENGTLKLPGQQSYYSLDGLDARFTFKQLNMAEDSRLTFLGCNMANGAVGRQALQGFADSTGIRTRAFLWTQRPGSRGMGPYVEAIPGHAQQFTGFRCNWDSLMFPAFLGSMGAGVYGLNRLVRDHVL